MSGNALSGQSPQLPGGEQPDLLPILDERVEGKVVDDTKQAHLADKLDRADNIIWNAA